MGSLAAAEAGAAVVRILPRVFFRSHRRNESQLDSIARMNCSLKVLQTKEQLVKCLIRLRSQSRELASR